MILLGKRIKQFRNKYKLTQTELATQIGVTKSTIAAYENDSRLPSYEVLIKMTNVFKISIDSLLLDRSEASVNVHGLTTEQIDIINILISYFRKANSKEDLLKELSPELKTIVKESLNTQLEIKQN